MYECLVCFVGGGLLIIIIALITLRLEHSIENNVRMMITALHIEYVSSHNFNCVRPRAAVRVFVYARSVHTVYHIELQFVRLDILRFFGHFDFVFSGTVAGFEPS